MVDRFTKFSPFIKVSASLDLVFFYVFLEGVLLLVFGFAGFAGDY